MVVLRVCILGALVAAGCAKPAAVADDAGGPGVGGNGTDDLGSDGTPDLEAGLRCGDHVCSPSIGETCETCPADCGMCAGCPMGFAHCDGNPADKCETPLNTVDNCGACGIKCLQVGGTNACVLVGTSYVCKPTCDATHADCNHNPNDGCEVDLTGPGNCGACGHACTNPNGTTTCTSQGGGYSCNPSCNPPYGACSTDKTQGCTTNLGNNPDDCGACGRACSSNNVTNRSCSGGGCNPTCAPPWSDCSHPAAPSADDGCETNGTTDPGEIDNTCSSPQYSNTNEGATSTLTASRILPSGDTDTFHIHATEGSHICFPGTSQSYAALIQLTPPPGVNLNLNYNVNGCDNTWKNDLGIGICVTWCGTCSATDDRDWYFQVYGVNGANACMNYTLTITYASEGSAPAGCTKPSC